MTGTLRRRVERLEGTAAPSFDLAALIEDGRRRAHVLTVVDLHAERLARAEDMRGRAAVLNRMERNVLAGLERALAA